MEIVDSDGDTCLVRASIVDFARLSKLIGWVIDSRSEMDEGRILLDDDAITAAINDWYGFIHDKVFRATDEAEK